MTIMRLTDFSSPAQVAAAARSALYLRLATALSFPSPGLIEEVASGRFLAGLEDEASRLPFALVIEAHESEALSDPSLVFEEIQAEYIRLFEVGPGRPPCPLYEGYHRSGRMKLMEETVRFYEHFGLKPHPGDQPDHLCAQLEFMHYLSFKEAANIGAGNPVAGLASAQRDFLARHLCRWLPGLQNRATECGAQPFYRALLSLAERYCREDERALRKRGGKPDAQIGLLPD